MKYNVDSWNNFCRVFELRDHYPRGFCFGGGKAVNFQMVDWFNPVPGVHQAGVSKDVWREKVGEIKTTEIDGDDLTKRLDAFIGSKKYIKPGKYYLVVCDFGLACRLGKPK